MIVLKIYLDTNFIRDVMERRSKSAIHLMEIIREKCNESKSKCFTSAFLLMELCDAKKDDLFFREASAKKWEFKKIIRERSDPKLQEHHFKEISEYMDTLIEEYPFLEKLSLSDEGWQVATDISASSNIWSPDAVHLATALSNECNLLITSDERLRKDGKIIVKNFKKYDLKIMDIKEAITLLDKK